MQTVEHQLDQYLRQAPRVGKDVFIASGAMLVGDVTVGDYSSIWYNAVLRADINRIVIGHHSNLQDLAAVHLSDDFPCIVGDYVTVGHSAVLHACTVGNETLIGMGATVLDGAVIGNQCIVGAKALVPRGMKVPEGSLVLGVPAKVVRPLNEDERKTLRPSADKYVAVAGYYLRHGMNAPVQPVQA